MELDPGPEIEQFRAEMRDWITAQAPPALAGLTDWRMAAIPGRVAMTTLGHERGGSATVQHLRFEREFWELVETAREHRRIADPLVRQQLAHAYTGVQLMRFNGLRTLARVAAGRPPGPEASIRMSGMASRRVVSSTSRSLSAGLDRSAAIATAVPPARLIWAAVSSIVPGSGEGAPAVVRAATATAAPSAPNRRAISAPMPRLAPVTRATFPSSTPIPAASLKPRYESNTRTQFHN
jgi:hypothetical protein